MLKLSEKMQKVQNDILNKSFFFFYLLLICSQVKPTIWAAFVAYIYLGALGAQVMGAFLDGVPVAKWIRMAGFLAIIVLCAGLYFTLLINPWCNMFFYANLFSIKYEKA